LVIVFVVEIMMESESFYAGNMRYKDEDFSLKLTENPRAANFRGRGSKPD